MNLKNMQILILSFALIIFSAGFYRFKTEWQLIFIALSALATITAYQPQIAFSHIVKHTWLILSFIIATITLLYTAAVWINPPLTPDGHRVMPLGQLFFSVPAGLLCSVLLSFVYFKKIRKEDRLEKIFFLYLTIALSISFIIDCIF